MAVLMNIIKEPAGGYYSYTRALFCISLLCVHTLKLALLPLPRSKIKPNLAMASVAFLTQMEWVLKSKKW